jgi:hypothetical protein
MEKISLSLSSYLVGKAKAGELDNPLSGQQHIMQLEIPSLKMIEQWMSIALISLCNTQ